MRLRTFALLSVALAVAAPAQTWEKLLAPGLTFHSELDANIPRVINALRWTPKSASVTAVPELAGGTVYDNDPTLGRETVSSLARRTGAIAAVNADFFPYTGDPLGLMVRAGELVSMPFPGRMAFGWGKEIVPIRATSAVTFSVDGGPSIPIPQLNESIKDDSIALDSERAGIARGTATSTYAVIAVSSGDWKVGGHISGVVDRVGSGQALMPVAKNSCVLIGAGSGAPAISSLRSGARIDIDLRINGFDPTRTFNIVGGGPNLVTRGLIATDGLDEGFKDEFVNKRHPRTAIGSTQDGDIWIVTIDGRQSQSDGATIDELARVMQRLGCMEAINLDGGGSTTLNVFGMTVNRPQDGKEREIASGIAFYGSLPPKEAGEFSIAGPSAIAKGSTTYLKIVDDKKQTIPNSEILWSATGSGWIDQGGFLRATAEGTIFVSAFVRGQIVPLGISVQLAGGKG
jgi:hypothetical protein